MDISSSTVTGLFTWPEMLNSFVPINKINNDTLIFNQLQSILVRCHFLHLTMSMVSELGLRSKGRGFKSNSSMPSCKRQQVFVEFSPEFLGLPRLKNQEPPLRQISGATATVSTLATVVGHPKTPTSAGNGGLSLGLP